MHAGVCHPVIAASYVMRTALQQLQYASKQHAWIPQRSLWIPKKHTPPSAD
jgi:hypothetical protein